MPNLSKLLRSGKSILRNGAHIGNIPTVATKVMLTVGNKEKELTGISPYFKNIMLQAEAGKVPRVHTKELLSNYTGMPAELAEQHIASTNALRSMSQSDPFGPSNHSIPLFSNASADNLVRWIYGKNITQKITPNAGIAFYNPNTHSLLSASNAGRSQGAFISTTPILATLSKAGKEEPTIESYIEDLYTNGFLNKKQYTKLLQNWQRNPQGVLNTVNKYYSHNSPRLYVQALWHELGGHGLSGNPRYIFDDKVLNFEQMSRMFRPGSYFSNPLESAGALSRIRAEASGLFAQKYGRLPGMQAPNPAAKTSEFKFIDDKELAKREIKEALDMWHNKATNPHYNAGENVRIRNQYTPEGSQELEKYFLENSLYHTGLGIHVPGLFRLGPGMPGLGMHLPNWFRYGFGFGIPTMGAASYLSNNTDQQL